MNSNILVRLQTLKTEVEQGLHLCQQFELKIQEANSKMKSLADKCNALVNGTFL